MNSPRRMESHSLSWRIRVSAATRGLLHDRFDFERRSIIEVKPNGVIKAFFLSELRT